MHHKSYLPVCLAVSLLLTPFTAFATGLLAPGTRSGTASVFTSAGSSGGGPFTTNLTQPVPATGPGNVDLSASSGTFGTGGNVVTAASFIHLNEVNSDTYSLNAGCSYSYLYNFSSGDATESMSYSFSQSIIVAAPVNYSLTLTARRVDNYAYLDDNHQGYTTTSAPFIKFSGPGINDMAVAPVYNAVSNPNPAMLTTLIYTGTLNPGTYTFNGSWTSFGDAGNWQYGQFTNNGNVRLPLQNLEVTGQLAVTVIPEPSFVLLGMACLPFLRRARA